MQGCFRCKDDSVTETNAIDAAKMASIVRNLLRSSSSMGADTAGESRSLHGADSMKNSPSFSDFSAGAATDAAEPWMDTSEPEALSQRSSMDQSMMSGSGLSSRSSIEPLDFRSHLKRISGAFGSPHSAGSCGSQTSSNATSEPVDVPKAPQGHPTKLASQGSCPPSNAQVPRRRREGKIDGLDYYDWSEMLRSTSL